MKNTMTYAVRLGSPRTKYSLFLLIILVFSLPAITFAQTTGALVPVIGFVLSDDEEASTEFSCNNSITEISPFPGSIIARNDSVSAKFNYTLRNRPAGIRVEVRPNLITSLEELDNFQDTQGLSLNPQVTTLVDIESTDSDVSGTIAIERTNDGSNIGLTSRTFNDLVVFVTLSRQDPDSGTIFVIGFGTFECASRVSETVNWTFTR